MIYLLGAKGKIGTNIAGFLSKNNITFIKVTKEKNNESVSFNTFINTAQSQKNILIINAAILNKADINSLTKSFKKNVRIIHISSVSVYGNSNLSNAVKPINSYGRFKVSEENTLKENFKICIVRLANIYGGSPETSGVSEMYKSKKLKYIEIDNENNELIRDYVHVNDLLFFIYNNLNFKKSQIVNISTGLGMSSSEFFKTQKFKLKNFKKKLFDKKQTIKISVIDHKYKEFIN
jgi:dTDP-4-dehydrorhamnose reductase